METTVLLFILGYVAFIFGDGFSDGTAYRLKHERHWTKLVPQAGAILMVISLADILDEMNIWLLLLAIILSKKPLFDIGWSMGAKMKGIFIGTTDWSDIIMRKLGLVYIEKNKFPIITLLYGVCIFVGLLLFIHSTRA